MARAHEKLNKRAINAAVGSRPSGRPRDAALDEAIILATRDRLVRDGYSRMTIGDIAADAHVSRPTLYRRWDSKFELVVDALDYGFRKQHDRYGIDLDEMEPREALVEAVRRLDPAYFNPDAMVLMGNFAGEAIRTPQLLEILREHAVEPRVALVENMLAQLQKRGVLHDDIDKRTIATMCFGSYFAAFYRGDSTKKIPESIVAVLWPGIAKKTSGAGRRASGPAKGRGAAKRSGGATKSGGSAGGRSATRSGSATRAGGEAPAGGAVKRADGAAKRAGGTAHGSSAVRRAVKRSR